MPRVKSFAKIFQKISVDLGLKKLEENKEKGVQTTEGGLTAAAKNRRRRNPV